MHGEQDREVGGRLVDTHPADRVDEDIVAAGLDAAVTVQHSQQQREPLRVEAHGEALRHAALDGVDQRLDLDQQRPRAFERGDDRRTRRTDSACCDRKSADGLATPLSPRSVIANTPSSLAAPKRFLIARTRRKLECVSPSK